MKDNDENNYKILADVRGCCNGKNAEKLLFQLVEGDEGITILLKRKGEHEVYFIPLCILLEAFNADIEAIKHCTRVTVYENNLRYFKN